MAQESQTARYNAYHQASRTVAKTRQVVMLYDGAIRFLTQAKDAAATGDHERRYLKLARAGDIIAALQAGLDPGEGRAMAARLQRFYQSLSIRLLQLHYATTLQDYDRVLEELKAMRAVWDAIDRGEQAPPLAAGPATLPSDPLAQSA